MAKQQTFSDKLKKKKGGADGIHVKTIKAFRSKTGSIKFDERFVKVKDASEIENIEL